MKVWEAFFIYSAASFPEHFLFWDIHILHFFFPLSTFIHTAGIILHTAIWKINNYLSQIINTCVSLLYINFIPDLTSIAFALGMHMNTTSPPHEHKFELLSNWKRQIAGKKYQQNYDRVSRERRQSDSMKLCSIRLSVCLSGCHSAQWAGFSWLWVTPTLQFKASSGRQRRGAQIELWLGPKHFNRLMLLTTSCKTFKHAWKHLSAFGTMCQAVKCQALLYIILFKL